MGPLTVGIASTQDEGSQLPGSRCHRLLQGSKWLEQCVESIRFAVADAHGLLYELTGVAYDGDHRIRCVCVDPCDKRRRTLRIQRNTPHE